MPDLSHLTAEERQIIESVLLRQREEEEKEQEILRYTCSAMSAIFVSHNQPLIFISRPASQRRASYYCLYPLATE